MTLKRYHDAITALRESARIDPDNARTWYFLGGAYHFSGQRSEAMEVYKVLRGLDAELANRLFNILVPGG